MSDEGFAEKWIERFYGIKAEDGVLVAPGLCIKRQKGVWTTVSQYDLKQLLSIVPDRKNPDWWIFITMQMASKTRWKGAKTVIDDDPDKISECDVLLLSPSPDELKYYAKARRLVCSDPHEEYLQNLLMHHVDISVAEITTINLNDGFYVCGPESFNIITCIMVLNGVEEYESVLRHIARALKKYGYAVVGVHLGKCDMIGGRMFSWTNQIGMHCSLRGEKWLWTEECFVSDCEAAGLAIAAKFKVEYESGNGELYLRLVKNNE